MANKKHAHKIIRENSKLPSPQKNILTDIKKTIKRIPILWRILGVVLIVLGLPNTYNYYVSRVSIIPSHIIDPINPLKDTFLMTNDGNFSIYDVNIWCSLANVKYANDNAANSVELFNTTFIKEMPPLSGETIQIPTNLFDVKYPVLSADISINVSFRPSFWLSKKIYSFRFTTLKGVDGVLFWNKRLTEDRK